MTDSPATTRKVPVVSVIGLVALILTVALNSIVGLLLIGTRQASVDTANRLTEYATCTAGWQQQFATSYKARIEAVKKVDEAQDGVFRAVAAEDPEAFHKALRNYIQLRDEQVQERAENPLPPLPDVLCGNPEEAGQ